MDVSNKNNDPLAQFPEITRWLSILPLSIVAAIFIPWLIYLFNNYGYNFAAEGTFWSGIYRLIQSGLLGFFFVATAGFVAPRYKQHISIVFAIALLILMTILGTLATQNLKSLDLGYQIFHLISAVVGGAIAIFIINEFTKELESVQELEDIGAKFWFYGIIIVLLSWIIAASTMFGIYSYATSTNRGIIYTSQSHGFSVKLPLEPEVKNTEENIEGSTVKTSTFSVLLSDEREYYITVYDYTALSNYDIDQEAGVNEILQQPILNADGITLVNNTKYQVEGYPAAKASYTEEKESEFNDFYMCAIGKDLKYYSLLSYKTTKSQFEEFCSSFKFN